MPLPRVYVQEPCPLDGYDGLAVRVLANATESEWRIWAGATLGDPGCADCVALRGADTQIRPYCAACTAARVAWGCSIVLLYGPTLLEHDVSTHERALALWDDDDALPTEIFIWLQLAPSVVRKRRQDTLTSNYLGSVMTPSM